MTTKQTIDRFLSTACKVEGALLYLEIKIIAHHGDERARRFLRLYTFNPKHATMH